jgi:hypothetical protein
MSKPPEEGEIWEWRAFGHLKPDLLEKVRTRPVRMGVLNLPGEDIYLVSPTSDQNLKLRKWREGWVLKFKLLLTTAPRSIELYTETAGWVYGFPISQDLLDQAARLLGTTLPDQSRALTSVGCDELLEALSHSSPPVTSVGVKKIRSQYEFEGGWVELAQVEFPRHKTEAISIHSPDHKVVERILDELEPTDLDVLNYVEACRRWS